MIILAKFVAISANLWVKNIKIGFDNFKANKDAVCLDYRKLQLIDTL